MADMYGVDFASLRVLMRVHALGSFSRAAESLGVGQPSVSYTIARLREVFDDPLFARQGGGIAPTARCGEIVEELAPMVARFEALAAPRSFDPAEAQLEMTISCNFYERVVILPELTRMLRREAAGITLRVIPSQVRGREQLKRGECDILLGPMRLEEAGYYRRTLLSDHYVTVMDADHPLAGQSLNEASFDELPQIVVNYGGAFRSGFLIEMERQGRLPNTVIEVASPANLPELLRGSDLVACVPRQTALHFGGAVAIAECPVKAQVAIDMQWAPRTHASAAHVWLRGEIASATARHLAKG